MSGILLVASTPDAEQTVREALARISQSEVHVIKHDAALLATTVLIGRFPIVIVELSPYVQGNLDIIEHIRQQHQTCLIVAFYQGENMRVQQAALDRGADMCILMSEANRAPADPIAHVVQQHLMVAGPIPVPA